MRQLSIPFKVQPRINSQLTGKEKIREILSHDLDFHDGGKSYDSHALHSFPAKFPPELPRKFIQELTQPAETVLDPMMGSGTTVLEAYLSGRLAVGFDIDPLAVLISRVKMTPLDKMSVSRKGYFIIERAKREFKENSDRIARDLSKRWDKKTREFIDYWFWGETQLELASLMAQIEKEEELQVRAFFTLVVSSIIITKSGGVSLSRDLAHTRPHKIKVLLSKEGKILMGEDCLQDVSNSRLRFQTKTLRSPIEEFEKRFKQNLRYLDRRDEKMLCPGIHFGNAQSLPLQNESVDLIVTSPPYASNAIDYMRAHKFSLVWMGYKIENLGNKRKKYIGGEVLKGFDFLNLPDYTKEVVRKIAARDTKKGLVLHRYYSEMTKAIREMFRVLKPGKTAVLVVGNSSLRGLDTETQNCLAEIGNEIGFRDAQIGERALDRNKRMMPAGAKVDLESQIQKRMHKEYVICLSKF